MENAQLNPVVTIFLSSYNHENFIKYAIDSVLNQSFSNFELIIFDDGSTDNSWEIISSYNDPRIKKFKADINQGRDTFLPLLDLAQGKYIARHHCDDVWDKHKLLKQVEFLENNMDYGAVFTQVQAIDTYNNSILDSFARVFEQPNRSRFEWLRVLFSYNPFCHPSVLIRTLIAKEIYGGKTEYVCNIDQLFWIRLCLRHNVHVLQERLTFFRIQEKNSNDGGNNQANMNSLFNEIHFLLDYYRRIREKDEFLKVFPECVKYVVNNEIVIPYALAHICMEQNHISYYHFGLNTLFEAMATLENRQKIRSLYNFTHKDLKKLSGKRNVYTGALNVQEEGAVNHMATLQILSDSGKGNEVILQLNHRLDHHIPFALTFDLNMWKSRFPDEKIKNIIFCPTQELFFNCRILQCTLDNEKLEAKPMNAVHNYKGKDIFAQNKPYYQITTKNSSANLLKIEGNLTI